MVDVDNELDGTKTVVIDVEVEIDDLEDAVEAIFADDVVGENTSEKVTDELKVSVLEVVEEALNDDDKTEEVDDVMLVPLDEGGSLVQADDVDELETVRLELLEEVIVEEVKLLCDDDACKDGEEAVEEDVPAGEAVGTTMTEPDNDKNSVEAVDDDEDVGIPV